MFMVKLWVSMLELTALVPMCGWLNLLNLLFLSSFSEPSAVLSETMSTKPAQTHVYIFWVVHLLAG